MTLVVWQSGTANRLPYLVVHYHMPDGQGVYLNPYQQGSILIQSKTVSHP